MGFPIRGDSRVVGDFRFAYPPPPGVSQIGVGLRDFIPDHPRLAWTLRCTLEVRQKVYPTRVIVNGEPLI
jgi:hypothetical protein